jgi:hypothetical protein
MKSEYLSSQQSLPRPETKRIIESAVLIQPTDWFILQSEDWPSPQKFSRSALPESWMISVDWEGWSE